MKSYISKWKKQYAEEAQRTAVTAAAAGNRNRNHNSMTMNLGNPLIPVNSTPAPPTGNGTSTNLPSINPPPTPLPLHSPMPPSQQHQQQSHLQNSQSLNSYHLSGNSIANNVMYDHGLMPLPQQTHGMSEIREYIQMEKPPPMYPGSAQPQHAMPPQSNPTSHGGYVHSTHLDPIEQALTKGDWSGVSDRSLLQYALQVMPCWWDDYGSKLSLSDLCLISIFKIFFISYIRVQGILDLGTHRIRLIWLIVWQMAVSQLRGTSERFLLCYKSHLTPELIWQPHPWGLQAQTVSWVQFWIRRFITLIHEDTLCSLRFFPKKKRFRS